MALQYELTAELRRFLAINFRVGSRESTYLVGPTLISTRDYIWFHFWDEPSAAILGEDDCEAGLCFLGVQPTIPGVGILARRGEVSC
jgi:hypothetical protein